MAFDLHFHEQSLYVQTAWLYEYGNTVSSHISSEDSVATISVITSHLLSVSAII